MAEKKFNQQEYINEYNRKAYKQYRIRIRREKTDLIEYIDSLPNKQSYIIGLIETDMKKKST